MIDAAPTYTIPIRPGRPPLVERDAEPTLSALRHAERMAYMDLARAHADLVAVPPRGVDAAWTARNRVARRAEAWARASDAYFAALADWMVAQ